MVKGAITYRCPCGAPGEIPWRDATTQQREQAFLAEESRNAASEMMMVGRSWMEPALRLPIYHRGKGLPSITFWLFVRSSWTMGCGNWETRYERVRVPEA
jgi:hypothetical protein